jgi:cytochrome c-type biogenesis protein CcmH
VRKLKRWGPWLLMALVVAGALILGPQGGGHTSPTERARNIAAGVRCPTCGGESALESNAPISQAIRAEIDRRIGAGQSDGTIRSYLVSRYGQSILLKPPTSGVSGLVWVLPVLALLAALFGVGRSVFRWRSRGASRQPSEEERATVERARRASFGHKTADTQIALEEQRSFLLSSLADLDRERAAGDLDQATYQALRDDTTARAAALLRDIERAKTVKRPARPRTATRRWRLPAMVAGAVALAGASLLVAGAASPRHAGQTATGSIGLTSADPLTQARDLAQQGKTDEALKHYDQILANDPQQPEALAYRGLLLALSGQTDVGMASVERAITADPTYAVAHYLRGVLLSQQGDTATAAAEFRAALANNPPQDVASAAQDALRQLQAAAPGK